MTDHAALLAEVAARYGASVAPGARVRRLDPAGSPAEAHDWRVWAVPAFAAPAPAAGRRPTTQRMRRSWGEAQRSRGEATRRRIADLRDQGMTPGEIVGATGLSVHTVYAHLRALREAGR